MSNASTVFGFFTIRAEGSADHIVPGYGFAVKVALGAAQSVAGRRVEIIDDAGRVRDSWIGSYDREGRIAVRSCPARVGMSVVVEGAAEIASILGVA